MGRLSESHSTLSGMSRKRRSRPVPEPAPESASALESALTPDVASMVGLITAGAVDAHLPLLTRTIQQRHRQVREKDAQRAMAAVPLGARVRINRTAVPQYLRGTTGTVTGFTGRKVEILLDRSHGRCGSCLVRVGPLSVDVLGPG